MSRYMGYGQEKCKCKSQSNNPANWKNFRPEFVNIEADLDGILDSWMKEECQRRSRTGAENKKKVHGDLEGEKKGKRASKVHMFEILHKRNKDKGDWCDTRSEKVMTTYNESIKVADGGVNLVAGVDGRRNRFELAGIALSSTELPRCCRNRFELAEFSRSLTELPRGRRNPFEFAGIALSSTADTHLQSYTSEVRILLRGPSNSVNQYTGYHASLTRCNTPLERVDASTFFVGESSRQSRRTHHVMDEEFIDDDDDYDVSTSNSDDDDDDDVDVDATNSSSSQEEESCDDDDLTHTATFESSRKEDSLQDDDYISSD
uniref:GRAS protein n=1 Tax=Tanacetum cinerariifolium TaxID=118510 RepID=A0A6L2KWU0_TANCI|nr:GRAS protein [Tanacetum cinerariifolium]